MIPWRNAGDAGAHLQDDASTLMAHNERYATRPVPYAGMQITAAYPCRRYAYPDLTRLGAL